MSDITKDIAIKKKKSIDDVFTFDVCEKIVLLLLVLWLVTSFLSINFYSAISEQKDKIYEQMFTFRLLKSYDKTLSFVKNNHKKYVVDTLEPEHVFLAVKKISDTFKLDNLYVKNLTFTPIELGGKNKISKLDVFANIEAPYNKYIKILESFKEYNLITEYSFKWGTFFSNDFPQGWKIALSMSIYYKGKLSAEMLEKLEELKINPVSNINTGTPQPIWTPIQPQTKPQTPTQPKEPEKPKLPRLPNLPPR